MSEFCAELQEFAFIGAASSAELDEEKVQRQRTLAKIHIESE